MATAILSGRSRKLPVPYLAQPTSNTCQSTCLKMFAMYLEQRVIPCSPGMAARSILDIWKDVNESAGRPSQIRNAHANLKWWLEHRFPQQRFEYLTITDEVVALERIIRFIDGGYPVLVAVSHARVPGHIVLVVGYENYQPNQSSADFALLVHDPYGSFDPSLLSKLYGNKRWEGGMSLPDGGEIAPGKDCRLPVTAVSRQRGGDAARGTYYLLSTR
jgi:hypothetical protein